MRRRRAIWLVALIAMAACATTGTSLTRPPGEMEGRLDGPHDPVVHSGTGIEGVTAVNDCYPRQCGRSYLPLVDVAIVVTSDSRTDTTRTDYAGNFYLATEPGEFTVTVTPEAGADYQCDNKQVSVHAGNISNVVFVCRPAEP